MSTKSRQTQYKKLVSTLVQSSPCHRTRDKFNYFLSYTQVRPGHLRDGSVRDSAGGRGRGQVPLRRALAQVPQLHEVQAGKVSALTAEYSTKTKCGCGVHSYPLRRYEWLARHIFLIMRLPPEAILDV